MSSLPDAYDKLRARGKDLALLGATTGLLSWDQETLLPPKGHSFRAEQSSLLAGISHRLATHTDIARWLDECESTCLAPNSPEAAAIARWRHDYERATRIPAELVEENELAIGLSRTAWVEARKNSHFPTFAPHLEKLLSLSRQMADLWGYSDQPYDALLEGYEPGWLTKDVTTLFGNLRPRLVSIAEKAFALPSPPSRANLRGHYPRPDQEKFLQSLLPKIGFDVSAGRHESLRKAALGQEMEQGIRGISLGDASEIQAHSLLIKLGASVWFQVDLAPAHQGLGRGDPFRGWKLGIAPGLPPQPLQRPDGDVKGASRKLMKLTRQPEDLRQRRGQRHFRAGGLPAKAHQLTVWVVI